MVKHDNKQKISGKQLLIEQNDSSILATLHNLNLLNLNLKIFNDNLYTTTNGKEDVFWHISDNKKIGTAVVLKILFMLYYEGIILEKLSIYSKRLLNKSSINKSIKVIDKYKELIDMPEFIKTYGIQFPKNKILIAE
jgi:hypothetical protein